jgi:hypothetical protein
MATGPETRPQELGIKLPATPAPAGAYVPATRAGKLSFTAGQLPLEAGEPTLRGKVGDADVPMDVPVEVELVVEPHPDP